jgi:hypothetical protein
MIMMAFARTRTLCLSMKDFDTCVQLFLRLPLLSSFTPPSMLPSMLPTPEPDGADDEVGTCRLCCPSTGAGTRRSDSILPAGAVSGIGTRWRRWRCAATEVEAHGKNIPNHREAKPNAPIAASRLSPPIYFEPKASF